MERTYPFSLWKRLLFCVISLFLHAGTSSQLLAQDEPEAVILGRFAKGPVGVPIKVDASTFPVIFGSSSVTDWPAELQASRFFVQGGPSLHVIRANPDGALLPALTGNQASMTGLHALPLVRNFGILICPELTLLPNAEIPSALSTCKTILGQRRATVILDPPPGWTAVSNATSWVTANIPSGTPRFTLYYPYLRATIGGSLRTFGSSGTIAATWLKNDATSGRGIWSAPSGNHLPIVAESLSQSLTDAEQTNLTNFGIGLIRTFTGIGTVPWSARHLDGGVSGNPDNRYIPVQRTLDWTSHRIIRRGYTTAAHSPNNSALWSLLKYQTETILADLNSRGAFASSTASESYFVQCGLGSTMNAADVTAGRVIVTVGIAPLRPSEFIIQSYTWNTRKAAFPTSAPRLLLRPGENEQTRQLFQFATPGTTCTLKSSTDLYSWTNFANPVSGDGTWHRVSFSIAQPKRFFRTEQTELLPP
jgi:hypothetical protein